MGDTPKPGDANDELNRQRALSETPRVNLESENAKLRSQMEQVGVALRHRAKRIVELEKKVAAGCDGCQRVNEDYCRLRDLLRDALGHIQWMSGADDFAFGKKAHGGFAAEVFPFMKKLQKEFAR